MAILPPFFPSLDSFIHLLAHLAHLPPRPSGRSHPGSVLFPLASGRAGHLHGLPLVPAPVGGGGDGPGLQRLRDRQPSLLGGGGGPRGRQQGSGHLALLHGQLVHCTRIRIGGGVMKEDIEVRRISFLKGQMLVPN